MSVNTHNTTVIGIMGKATNDRGEETGVKGVGKDEFANYIIEEFKGVGEKCSLAEGIKKVVEDFFGLKRSYYDENPQFKEIPLERLNGMSYRKLCELIGTEIVRTGYSEKLPNLKIDTSDIWINKVLMKIKWKSLNPFQQIVVDFFDISFYECFPNGESNFNEIIPRLGVSMNDLEKTTRDLFKENKFPNIRNENHQLVIIPDVRFPNEYTMLHDKGYNCIIRVERMLKKSKSSGHVSDKTYDFMCPSNIINNNGTKENLKKTAKRFVNGINECNSLLSHVHTMKKFQSNK